MLFILYYKDGGSNPLTLAVTWGNAEIVAMLLKVDGIDANKEVLSCYLIMPCHVSLLRHTARFLVYH